jgi:hypothetical protein
MADETTPEVTDNSEGTPTPTPDPEQDAPRTEATDTRPPEEKEETAPVEPPKEETKPKTRRKTAAKPKADDDKEWSYEKPTPSITTRLQRGLGRHGYYYGPADGRFESKSVQGVQKALTNVGFEGVANGHIGEEQARLIQVFAKQFGNYTGAINKKIDENTWAGFAVGLERLK